jgi:hypothetical protein
VKTLLLATLLSVSSLGYAQEAPKDFAKRMEDILYGDLRKMEYVGYIYAHVKNEESSKIGLNDEELTNYVKLRFKNSFAGVQYKNLGNNISNVSNKSAVGYLWCGVWTVGDDYPIAYHIECRFGSMQNPRILTDAVLGYGNKNNVPDTIKKSLDDMMSRFAIQFFKTRGEL